MKIYHTLSGALTRFAQLALLLILGVFAWHGLGYADTTVITVKNWHWDRNCKGHKSVEDYLLKQPASRDSIMEALSVDYDLQYQRP